MRICRHTALRFALPCIIGLLLTCLCQSVMAKEEQARWPIKVTAAIDDAPPFRIIDGDEVFGIYVEIYELIMQQLSIETDYLEVPFPRALVMLQNGDADIMLGPIYDEERDDYIDYSLPAFPPVDRVFLVDHPRHAIHAYSDLLGKTIALQRGSSYFKKFNEDEGLKKVPLTDYRQALCMLESGRVDVVIIPEPIADILADAVGSSFIKSPYVVPGDTSYIAVADASPLRHHTKRLRETLKQVKNSQAYKDVFDRYLHWDKKIDMQCSPDT